MKAVRRMLATVLAGAVAIGTMTVNVMSTKRDGVLSLGSPSKLGDIAAQVTASAVDVASLGETFGFAVRSFSETNDKLMAQLQSIEAAMAKSMTRSDEQLAYYVAQAREVVDLSLLSQKQVMEELQQLATRRGKAGSA